MSFVNKNDKDINITIFFHKPDSYFFKNQRKAPQSEMFWIWPHKEMT